jgi:heme A synthase
MEKQRAGFSYLAWAVLAFTVLVILGGAIVRATGSGDGCGETWPACSDRIIPVNAGVETMIEFGHRLMSGAAILGIAALFFWSRRLYERGDLVRWGATAAGVLIVVEALVGASLVLFGWVDDDASIARMIVVPIHLVNTMLLLGALTVTAWWSSGRPRPRRAEHPMEARRLAIGAAGLLVVATLGAINALADTLYPADDFLSGVREELTAGAPFLVQARVLHPVTAILVGLGVAYLVLNLSTDTRDPTSRLGRIIFGLVLVQFGIGITNVLLATPLETQVVHLAIADAIWIAYVLFAASLLGEPVPAPHSASSRS